MGLQKVGALSEGLNAADGMAFDTAKEFT